MSEYLNMKEQILLVGAGGHAKACIDVIEQEGRFEIYGLIGRKSEVGSNILGYPVCGSDSDLKFLSSKVSNALVTIGQIKTAENRESIYTKLINYGFDLPTVVSPNAYVSNHARLGKGSIIMHGVVVNSGAVIGNNTILNSMSLVEHDSSVGNHCHISTGARLNGGVSIGNSVFVGSGAVVRQGIYIGDSSVIGMGQLVSNDYTICSKLPNPRGKE